MKKVMSLLFIASLLGCSQQSKEVSNENEAQRESLPAKSVEKNVALGFSDEMAKDNLTFVKDQYLKMITHVDNNEYVKQAKACDVPNTVCFPRAEEHEKIYLEKPTKWTNGFYPGLLWKLLAANEKIENFSDAEQAKILAKASFYQEALIPESMRGSTHDLGFILYDSFGEALNYQALSEQNRSKYLEILTTGRDTLMTRFSAEKGLIKSWDWGPTFPAHYIDEGKIEKRAMALANPWTFPVIVDNMMNLEFLLTDGTNAMSDVAMSHAKQTYLHHYFYAEDDVNKEFPIAYHLFDYDSMRPGNWQGVGNISAWARGQAWSLYGYVTVVEAMKNNNISGAEFPDFEQHVSRLINSVEKLLGDDYVPAWDFFATLPDAVKWAEDQSNTTVEYSRMLDLCDFEIPSDVTPYLGYRPIMMKKSLLSEETLTELSTMTSAYNEPFIQGDFVAPCGTKPYKNASSHVPKDTSAAALYAAALYRYANITDDSDVRQKSVTLADNIMLELTQQYLTSKNKGKDYQLGFVLAEATGNMPNASEINTSIVYADFYFLEANIRKLALTQR